MISKNHAYLGDSLICYLANAPFVVEQNATPRAPWLFPEAANIGPHSRTHVHTERVITKFNIKAPERKEENVGVHRDTNDSSLSPLTEYAFAGLHSTWPRGGRNAEFSETRSARRRGDHALAILQAIARVSFRRFMPVYNALYAHALHCKNSKVFCS